MTERRLDALLADQLTDRPDHLALIDGDGAQISFAALGQAVAAMAADLSARGLGDGDRLLIAAENAAAQVGLLLAASRIGAIGVPVNARMTAPELDRIIEHADPRLIVTLDHVSTAAAAHGARLGAQAWDTPLGRLAITAPRPEARPEPMQDGPARIAVILYTTGTTGTPKGVMLTHGNLMFGGTTSARVRRLSAADIILGVLPMTHVFGLSSMMVAALASGATLRLMTRFDAAEVLRAIAGGATVLPAVPQMHALIMSAAAAQGMTRAPGQLRYVSSGAAPLDPEWKRRAEAFYGSALQNGYGLTETTAGVTLTDNPPGVPDVSVGPALPGVDLIIASPDRDGVGEVLTRGPHVTPGYFRNPEATEALFDAEGWLHTGDLGRIDAQGNLHIMGRSKELIIRGGFNIYPPEVEAALNEHPGVIQSAVIGRKTEGGNEEVLAFCQVRDPALTEAALAGFAAERLSPYKRPARIVLTDALPAAPTGKILKGALIQTFADRL